MSCIPANAAPASGPTPWARIVYSSRTGNTRTLAARLSQVLGLDMAEARAELRERRESMDAAGRLPCGDMAGCGDEVLLLGFWAWRGGANPSMRDYMRGLLGRRVFVFGTMAAWPDSENARKYLASVICDLEQGGNEVIGHFLCQGRLDPVLRARSRHPHTPERMLRLDEAEKHPDEADLVALEITARAALQDLMP